MSSRKMQGAAGGRPSRPCRPLARWRFVPLAPALARGSVSAWARWRGRTAKEMTRRAFTAGLQRLLRLRRLIWASLGLVPTETVSQAALQPAKPPAARLGAGALRISWRTLRTGGKRSSGSACCRRRGSNAWQRHGARRRAPPPSWSGIVNCALGGSLATPCLGGKASAAACRRMLLDGKAGVAERVRRGSRPSKPIGCRHGVPDRLRRAFLVSVWELPVSMFTPPPWRLAPSRRSIALNLRLVGAKLTPYPRLLAGPCFVVGGTHGNIRVRGGGGDARSGGGPRPDLPRRGPARATPPRQYGQQRENREAVHVVKPPARAGGISSSARLFLHHPLPVYACKLAKISQRVVSAINRQAKPGCESRVECSSVYLA
mmetsp:Transcript_27664/g.89339  ORF Transcript_27664/g.89339 Transcript_27664/m.89339 type:complete len:374 (-) Transcript_27664:148-1269(-)